VAFSLLMFDQHYPYWSAAYLIGEAAALSLFLRSTSERDAEFLWPHFHSDYLYMPPWGFALRLIGTATSWVGNMAAVALRSSRHGSGVRSFAISKCRWWRSARRRPKCASSVAVTQ
jgi:hypothetical protein